MLAAETLREGYLFLLKNKYVMLCESILQVSFPLSSRNNLCGQLSFFL